ncbi:MAG: FAD-binding oxidoreductase [Rickettsiales bacterium]|nr:FAD-binding oxidoreductase [Rickettsiales bacterium]
MTSTHQLSGWGNNHKRDTLCSTPSFLDHAESFTGIARGYGRSYGDAAIGIDRTYITTRLHRFIDSDIESGLVTVEPGCTLQEIHDQMIPNGWGVAVTPGTRHVTAAGAFAANVHGKGHVKTGSFARHVKRITLMTGTGEELTCSPDVNTDLFWATAGGMGLTGLITSLTIQLSPMNSNHVDIHRQRVESINDAINWLDRTSDEFEQHVIWLDCLNGTAPHFKGIAEGANPSSCLDAIKPASTRHIAIPPQKFCWLKRWNMKLYNRMRYTKLSNRQSETVSHEQWSYPLDNIGQWNHLYGPKGFYQYQCLIPQNADREDVLNALFRCIDIYKTPVFLCVIKAHGAADESLLGFCDSGISLALDMPAHTDLRECVHALNQIIIEASGRIYLAKDALSNTAAIEKMYGDNLAKWRDIANRYDPDNRFHSAMNERLNLRGNL